MNTNPFKFGTVVDGSFFTNREDEFSKINSYLEGHNHLIMISPRRYGKTSLIKKVLNESGFQYIFLDMQLVITTEDFASQLLKRIYRIYPVQKLKRFVRSFRLIPSVIINPVTGETEISFRSHSKDLVPLEDVLNLIGELGNAGNKLVVIFDEFQEIFRIGDGLDRLLRSVIQNHSNINYVFLGSSESMIREIFAKNSSPFYRFGTLMNLGKIPQGKFTIFLEEKFKQISDKCKEITSQILEITGSHPFYTQQLAYTIWELLLKSGYSPGVVKNASAEIVQSHDNDYERLWNGINRTDMMVLTGIASTDISPLSDDFSRMFGTGATSTVFSSLKRLAKRGLLLKDKGSWILDDPFFKRWILLRREI